MKIYLSTNIKFGLAISFATLWFSLSLYLSHPWLNSLAKMIGAIPAYAIVLTIGLIPGFTNMFLAASLLLDRQPKLDLNKNFPPISILIALFNEENNIEETLRGILAQDYPAPIEIVAVDDGSTDKTIETLLQAGLPNLKVIRAPHRDKAAALNVGLDRTSNDLVVSIDADTFLWRQALSRLVARYLQDPPQTAAVAGSVLVKNSRASILARLQEFDYFLAIASAKRQQGLYQGTLVAQGAFSLFRKSSVKKVFGWPNVIGEDIVLTWALIKHGYRIGYEPTAIGFTKVPTDYRGFARQRKRWARGMIEGFRAHIDLIYRGQGLASLLVAMDLLYPVLDLAFTLVFIPGVLLALTGHFWIAGPMTLAVLPLTLAMILIMFKYQYHVFKVLDLKMRRNRLGFFVYLLFYQFLMSPICLLGYTEELFGAAKRW